MNTSSSPSLRDTMEVMETLDQQRLGAATVIDHEQWVKDIRAAYAAQGIEVDDDTIAAAIAKREAKALEVQLPSMWGRGVLWAYARRALLTWASMAMAAVGAVVLIAQGAYEDAAYATIKSTWSQAAQLHASNGAWLNRQHNIWSAPPTALGQRLAPDVITSLSAMDTTWKTLQVPVLPAQQAALSQDGTLARMEKAVAAEQSLIKAQAPIDLETKAMVADKQFLAWLAAAPSPHPDLQQPWDDVLAQYKRASALNQWQNLGNLAAAAGTLQNGSQSLTAADKLIATWPAKLKAKTEAWRTAERTAWASIHPAAAKTAHQALAAATAMLHSQFSLQIVSEPGEKSGVWRYPNDNTGVRNYYIVVDAKDAAGHKIRLPIVNEENNRTFEVSRFAVGVPESVYEKVKADKLDNGIINDNVLGTKAADTLDITYNTATKGGMITEW